MPGLAVDSALAFLKDAIRRNASATCPTCGHQPSSLRVGDSIADLVDAIASEQRMDAARKREAVEATSGMGA